MFGRLLGPYFFGGGSFAGIPLDVHDWSTNQWFPLMFGRLLNPCFVSGGYVGGG